MSLQAEFEEVLDSFINGQKRQFVEQFDNLTQQSDFIDYVCDLGYRDLIIDMMKSYFNIKGR